MQKGQKFVSNDQAPHRGAAVRDAHGTLWLGLTLASVGGFLDAFTFVGKGHVFANAMSGNVVLAALAFQSGDWSQAGRALSAIGAFMVGVMAANTLRLPQVSRVVRLPRITALVVEIGLLVLIGEAPTGIPNGAIVLGVTFVAAVQTSTFRQLADWPFTSTMSTGNLRSLGDAIVDWLTGRKRADARKIGHFATVCFAFFIGAAIGGVTTLSWGDRAAWVVALLASFCVILMALRIPKTRDHLPRRGWAAAHIFPKAGGATRGAATATMKPSQEKTS